MFFLCLKLHHVDPLLRKYSSINLAIHVKLLKCVEIIFNKIYVTDGYGVPYAIPYAVPVPVAPIIPFGGGCMKLVY